MFKEAAEAYEVLSNSDKKAKYDRFGHQAFDGQGGFGGGGFSNMDDIFSNFGDILETKVVVDLTHLNLFLEVSRIFRGGGEQGCERF